MTRPLATPFDELSRCTVFRTHEQTFLVAAGADEGAWAVVGLPGAGADTIGAAGVPDAEQFESLPLGDPWNRMREAAAHGVIGFLLPEQDGRGPVRVRFLCRLDECADDLPSVLGVLAADGGIARTLGRTGPGGEPVEALIPWQRWDKIDGLSGRVLGDRVPLDPWRPGDPLWELRSWSATPMLPGIAEFGPWPPAFGTFMFFSSEDAALWYLENNQEALSIAGWSHFSGEEGAAQVDQLRPHPVSCLLSRLEDLAVASPGGRVTIDPQYDRQQMMLGILGIPDRLASVNGIWEVLPGNSMRRLCPHPVHSGLDQFHWRGDQGWNLPDLDRTFAENPAGRHADLLIDATPAEVPEIVQHLLEQAPEPPTDVADAFVVVASEIMGDEVYVDFFDSPVDAISSLILLEESVDRPVRVAGLHPDNEVGLLGTGDEVGESHRGDLFASALTRIATNIVSTGSYTPHDGRRIATAAVHTLRSRRLEACGFLRDLWWAAASQPWPAFVLQEAAGDAAPRLQQWLEGEGQALADPRGSREAEKCMGPTAWSTLTPRAQMFLATALAMLDVAGTAPQLDYAPQGVELAKVLEVELVDLLATFRASYDGPLEVSAPENRNESQLIAFLGGQDKAITLTSFAYLLNRKKFPTESAASTAWFGFLESRTNGSFLTSSDLRRQLHDVGPRLRNGPAHTEPMTQSECEELRRILIGDVSSPGIVPQLIAWRDGPATAAQPATTAPTRPMQITTVVRPDPELPLDGLTEDERRALFDEIRQSKPRRRAHEPPPPGLSASDVSPFLDLMWSRDGTVYLIAQLLGFDGRDAMRCVLAPESVRALRGAIESGSPSWRHPNGTVEVLARDDGSLDLVFKRSGPPGGRILCPLTPGEADAFRSALGRVPASYETRRRTPTPAPAGRNDPCPCGSGLKFKKCCGGPAAAPPR